MRTKVILAAVVAAAFAGWAAESGWTEEIVRHPRGPAGPEALAELLGLSAEQTASVAQESESCRAASHELAEKIEGLRGKMEQANAASDKETLGSLLVAEWEVKQEAARLKQASREQLTAILTPAQQEKLRLVISVASLLHADAPFLRDVGIDRSFLGDGEREEHEMRHRPHPLSEGEAANVPGGRTIRHSADARPQRHEAAEK